MLFWYSCILMLLLQLKKGSVFFFIGLGRVRIGRNQAEQCQSTGK